MNMLKKGPDLKMPDLKVPDFLLDLYYDLRARHLLPLVAILLVAIVALPIVLSDGSSDSESAESEVAIATPSTSSSGADLVVAKATPGLRDYRKRLAGTPTDPFIQKYATPPASGGSSAGTSSSSSPSSESPAGGAESPSATGAAPPAETPTPKSTDNNPPIKEGGGDPSATGKPGYYSFAIDVRIVSVPSDSSAGEAKPSVRRNLPELTMLPSREEPALTFMEVSKDERRVLMLVSDKVTGLFGDGVCVVGAEHCQLLALEKGIPETVVYGPQERTFRIELLNLQLLVTDKPHKASLGKHEGESPE